MGEKLLYVTGNPDKIAKAREHFEPYGLEFEASPVVIPEIKSLSLEEMAIYKANSAYDFLQRDLIINSSGWRIPALNGFPGPFMREMNEWLQAEDFLGLMARHTDRQILLENLICFRGAEVTRVFKDEVIGKILYEAKGTGKTSDRIVSLTADGRSIAELHNEGIAVAARSEAYDRFAQWYMSNQDR